MRFSLDAFSLQPHERHGSYSRPIRFRKFIGLSMRRNTNPKLLLDFIKSPFHKSSRPTIMPTDELQIDSSAIPWSDTGRNLMKRDESPASPLEPLEVLRLQADCQEFRKAFDDNMKNKPIHHDHGYVLLLSWEDELDDLQVKDEVRYVLDF